MVDLKFWNWFRKKPSITISRLCHPAFSSDPQFTITAEEMADPANWSISKEKADAITIKMPKWDCPTHGDIGEETIACTIKGYEGTWCMVCAVEFLDTVAKRATCRD